MFNYSEYYKTRFQAPLIDSSIIEIPDSPDFVSPMDSDLANINYVDSHGHIVDVLSQVLRTNSALERSKLLDLLEDNSSISGQEFAQLDDDTKIQLLKPRSIQSLAEMSSYTDYVQNFIEANNIQTTEPPQSTEPSHPTPSPQSPQHRIELK